MGKYVTVKELSEMTGRPISTIQFWIKQGYISGVRRGGPSPTSPKLIPVDEADRLVALLKDPAPV